LQSDGDILHLQVESLLQEISVNLPKSIKDYLVKIKGAIEQTTPIGPFSYDSALEFLKKSNLEYPWCIEQQKKVNFTFSYLPPSRIDVVGSLLVGGEKKGCLIERRNGFNVDLAVQIPDVCGFVN
jgi:hypothetical protein